jgi:hypothetical protein
MSLLSTRSSAEPTHLSDADYVAFQHQLEDNAPGGADTTTEETYLDWDGELPF